MVTDDSIIRYSVIRGLILWGTAATARKSRKSEEFKLSSAML